VPHVVGVAPFVINPMMVTHGERTATGVLLKGVDPDGLARVLDLPKHIVEGSLAGLRRPGAQPPSRSYESDLDSRQAPRDIPDVADAPEAGGHRDPLLREMQRAVEE